MLSMGVGTDELNRLCVIGALGTLQLVPGQLSPPVISGLKWQGSGTYPTRRKSGAFIEIMKRYVGTPCRLLI